MLTNENNWIENFKSFGEMNNAVCRVVKNPSVGYGASFLTCSLTLEFNFNSIVISQNGIGGHDEVGLSFLILEYCYENKNNFFLSLNKLDFFDRLFKKYRLKTDSVEFDDNFIIDSSNSDIALNIFRNKQIQDFFLSNSLLVFNCQTRNNNTSIMLKNMATKLYKHQELQHMLDGFLKILHKLLV